ncbi:MAG: phosphodiester glycosidase family protein [Bacilli bacterium]|nr:phosphodiester glycosidase family protein [Bacilli bacterium]
MKKKKKKLKLKRPRLHIFTYFVILLDLMVIALLVIIYTPVVQFKNFWIPTAMTTMSHRYLAYTLYSEESVNKVMSENYIIQVNENVNLDDIVIDTNISNKHYTSKYEKDMFTKDPGNDVYKIIRLEESNFKGYLTVIYDPSDVDLALPKKLGRQGQSVAKLCTENGGLVGINGGGFEDLDGWGNGSTPYGAIIKDGVLVWNHSGGDGGLIGFTKDHKMYLTTETPEVAISKGMDDAVEFGPFLIVNGKVAEIKGDGGWGRAPRTVIAQRQDGVVLFLEIEGRLPGYSIGATMNEVIEVLLRYKAYNAANLDGGASATMAVNGKLYNRPSAGGEYGGRTVSNAWIVTNKQNKAVPTTTKRFN